MHWRAHARTQLNLCEWQAGVCVHAGQLEQDELHMYVHQPTAHASQAACALHRYAALVARFTSPPQLGCQAAEVGDRCSRILPIGEPEVLLMFLFYKYHILILAMLIYGEYEFPQKKFVYICTCKRVCMFSYMCMCVVVCS